MRRIALILGCLVAGGVMLAAVAGAADKKTYQAELFNAFGLVEGSELRIAGVKAGTVTGLDITEEKTALITFEVEPEFPELKADASCSSEPQSLIAEYFLNCQPGASPEPLEGPIEAARNQTTVQSDLVNNVLREPFKRRFQLIINEFGTALTGNAENLNAAIRSGAPALRELSAVLKILGRQNTTIAQLNADSDAIFQQLTDRREDVARFIDEAEDAGRISADRREDLARNFDLLDDFLFELRPTMRELGNLARQQTPLLTDLRAAAPGLKKLGTNLPKFNNASRVSLESLGGAAEVGDRAVKKSTEEIAQLNVTAQKAPPAVEVIATFLESIDDPANAVEEDCDARYDLREQPGEADRRVQILNRKLGVTLTGSHDIDPVLNVDPIGCKLDPGSPPGNPGYTGLEGLLNYAYVQPAALNLFDGAGHALQIHIVGASSESEGGGQCGHYYPGHPDEPGHPGGWPTAEMFDDTGTDTDDHTRDPTKAVHCAAIAGDYQPGVSAGTVSDHPATEGLTQLIPGNGFAPGSPGLLPPYPGGVCPDASTWETICKNSNLLRAGFSGAAPGAAPAPGTVPTAQEKQPAPEEIQKALEDLKGKLKKPIEDLDKLRDKLGLPPTAPLPPEVTQGVGLGGSSNSSGAPPAPTGTGLLDFLLGP